MSLLALARHDGSTVVFRRDAGDWAAVQDARGQWPTWRPRHEHVLVSAVERSEARGGRASLRLFDAGTGTGLDVPGSISVPARLIADRLGHYANWSPDGSAVCYVVPAGRALAARVWQPGEATERTVLGGSPVFSSWSPDSRRLVVHHGASLTVFDMATHEERRISDAAAGFRTAAFMDDGRTLVYAEPLDDGVMLQFTNASEPGNTREGVFLRGGVALCPNPSDGRLAVAVTPGDDAGVFSHVAWVGRENGETGLLLKGPLLGFWWSPKGDRFAALVPSYTGDGRFQVRFHRSDGSFERAMEPTTLSQDMRTLVSFFDQYAQSHHLWSPDGRLFAMSGRLTGEGPHASFFGAPLDRVFLADAVAGGPWQPIGEGTAAFFPPPNDGRQVNEG